MPYTGCMGSTSTGVSIIIPVQTITNELQEAIPHLLALQPPADEIIIVPDMLPTSPLPATITIVPKSGGPAAKRDVAAAYAAGDILAFLDDDAYPQQDWLAHAVRHFADPAVVAVGGPAVTPPHDAVWQQISGAVLTSWLGSGPARMRYAPVGQVRPIDDWPSVNLIVRRAAFAAVGGFGTSVWPGEDTKLCLEFVSRGWKILYDPQAMVYHHRATTLLKHLQQVARYGLHRGHFVRKFPATSRRLSYFLPSLALAGLVAVAALAVVLPASRLLVSTVVAAVVLIVVVFALLEAWRSRQWAVAILYPVVLLLTHLVYGTMFLHGLLASSLKQYQRSTR